MNLVAARAVSVIPACAQIVLALAIIVSTSALVKEGSVPLSFLTMCIWSTTFWGVMLRTLRCLSTGPLSFQALTLIMKSSDGTPAGAFWRVMVTSMSPMPLVRDRTSGGGLAGLGLTTSKNISPSSGSISNFTVTLALAGPPASTSRTVGMSGSLILSTKMLLGRTTSILVILRDAISTSLLSVMPALSSTVMVYLPGLYSGAKWASLNRALSVKLPIAPAAALEMRPASGFCPPITIRSLPALV